VIDGGGRDSEQRNVAAAQRCRADEHEQQDDERGGLKQPGQYGAERRSADSIRDSGGHGGAVRRLDRRAAKESRHLTKGDRRGAAESKRRVGRARAGGVWRREMGQRALGVRGAVARALLLSGRGQVRALRRGQSSRCSASASSVPHGGERRGGSTNEDKGARGMLKGAGCSAVRSLVLAAADAAVGP
jgi:hypothetical protein